jgi:MFS family permease
MHTRPLPTPRSQAMLTRPQNGPVIGPIVGGFVFQALDWRWTNWVVMIGSGASFFLVLCRSNPPNSLLAP